MAKVRVRYGKLPTLRWLSHLEVARAIERSLRRTGLAVEMSQGFNPHPRISYGTSLPVGVSGCTEYFDVAMASDIAPSELGQSLAQSMSAGMICLGTRGLASGEPSLQAVDSLQGYHISLPKASHAAAIIRAKSQESYVTVERKGVMKRVEQPTRLVKTVELLDSGTLSPGCGCGTHQTDEECLWVELIVPAQGGGLRIRDVLFWLDEVSDPATQVVSRTMFEPAATTD